MPPRSGLIPQPWPQVSPVHTKLVRAACTGAVRNDAVPTSPEAPSSDSKCRRTSYSRPGASPCSGSFAVRSDEPVAQPPTTSR